MATETVPEISRGAADGLSRELVGHFNSISGFLAHLQDLISAAGLQAATQAQTETATDDTVAVTPAQSLFIAGAAKAFVLFDASSGTPVIALSMNITSLTDRGAGLFTANITRPFSSNAIGISGSCGPQGASFYFIQPDTAGLTASAVQFSTVSIAGVATDLAYNFVAFYGDLA